MAKTMENNYGLLSNIVIHWMWMVVFKHGLKLDTKYIKLPMTMSWYKNGCSELKLEFSIDLPFEKNAVTKRPQVIGTIVEAEMGQIPKKPCVAQQVDHHIW